MATRILVELILFLTPFAVFLAYRAASRDMKIRDRWPLTTLVLIGAGLAGAALVVTPLLTPSDQGKCYQAARYENGVTIPAQMVDCEEAVPPGPGVPETTSPPPVPPRDQGGG
jgi:hypothetical protein